MLREREKVVHRWFIYVALFVLIYFSNDINELSMGETKNSFKKKLRQGT